MKKFITEAKRAKLILIPKGDDSQPCLKAFEDATGIKVPEFDDRKLEASLDGKTFLKVKGRDIPRFIAAGYGDIGLTGSDSCEEFIDDSVTGIAYKSFEPVMCRFVLLAPRDKLSDIKDSLKSKLTELSVATSFPTLLNKCAGIQKINLIASELEVTGSVEIMPRLFNVPLVADLVSSGLTAEANGLVEVQTLAEVYPAIVIRNGR